MSLRVLFLLGDTGIIVGPSYTEVRFIGGSGHCTEDGRLPFELWSLSGVDVGVASAGSSAIPTEGDASTRVDPECSVIAERGEPGNARSGIAFSIRFRRRVFGREKECAENEARKLRVL